MDTSVVDSIQTISRLVLSEAGSPEIQPFAETEMDIVVAALARREAALEVAAEQPTQRDASVVYEMEFQRVTFLISWYTRVRLEKLSRNFAFYLADPSSRAKLSSAEEEFLRSYADATGDLLNESVLQHAPKLLALATVEAGEHASLDSPMIPKPDLERTVIARARRDVFGIVIDEARGQETSLAQGDIMALPYRSVRPHLGEDVELL
jgi:hypothetical protein